MSRERGIYREVDKRKVFHSQYEDSLDDILTIHLGCKIDDSVYSSLVQWPKIQKITASRSLAKIQRTASLNWLSAVKGTLTTAMEVVLYCIPDISIMSAYRLKCNGS